MIVLVMALLCSSGAVALPRNVDVADIVRNPQPLVGREIRLASVRCAQEPEGKYACRAGKVGEEIRIESLALDFQTSDAVRRRIAGRCSARVERVDGACTFDVELRIATLRTSAPKTGMKPDVVIIARRMNLYPVSRS